MARRTSPNDTTRRSPATTLLAVAAASALVVPAAALATPAAAADPGPQTTDRHIVVLVNFRSAKLTEPDVDRQEARSRFFGPTGSLASYYAANSGGRFAVAPAKGDGVLGPFDLDMDNATCDTNKMAELARKALPADVTYDHVSIVIPSTKACQWWGLGHQPGSVTWLQEGAVKDTAAIVHEVGHNLGLAHQEWHVCTPGSFTACTADGYSARTPMGGGGEKKGLSAPELLALKWLTPQQTTTPTATATVRLTPLHAAANTSGVRAIDLPLGSGGDRVVVEYRTPDAGTPDINVAQGVVVYRVPKGRYDHAVMITNSKRDDKTTVGSFKAGAALTDTANGLSIGVTGSTAAGAEVRITLGNGSTPDPNPGPTSSASPSRPGTGTTPTHTAAPTSAQPTPTRSAGDGDDATDIGSTALPPRPTETTTTGGAASLAHTGADVTVPAVLGSTLVLGGGALALLLRRRRAQHRRH
ncbi:hypothetical protein [Kitasatospora sp. NPDC088346]|uniref:hypothetical protein n=1 Tax=Kitasatospora sp. NPDC088346 TaxID=3364073 RepID=UPI00381FE949